MIPLKKIIDIALLECPSVEKVIILKKIGTNDFQIKPDRDRWWHEEMVKEFLQ